MAQWSGQTEKYVVLKPSFGAVIDKLHFVSSKIIDLDEDDEAGGCGSHLHKHIL